MPTRVFSEDEVIAVVDDILARCQGAKTMMCENEPMSENPHVMCVAYANDIESEAPMAVHMFEMEDGDDVVEQMVATLSHVEIKPFVFVAMMGEAYHRSDNVPENYEKGDMKTDFETNPASSVKECVIVNAVDWKGKKLHSRVAPYVYDDKGVPRFEETISSVVPATPQSGRIAELLSLFVLYMRNEVSKEMK